jgi:hypothetical protein
MGVLAAVKERIRLGGPTLQEKGLEIEHFDAGLGESLEEGGESGDFARLKSGGEGLGVDRGLGRDGDYEEADAAFLEKSVELHDAGKGIGLVGGDLLPGFLPESTRREVFDFFHGKIPLRIVAAHGGGGAHLRGGGFGKEEGSVLRREGAGNREEDGEKHGKR